MWKPKTHKVSGSHCGWQGQELRSCTGFSTQTSSPTYLHRLEVPTISASLFPAQTKLADLSVPLWIGCPSADTAKQLGLMFHSPNGLMKTADFPSLPSISCSNQEKAALLLHLTNLSRV